MEEGHSHHPVENETCAYRKTELDPYLTLHTAIDLKQIKHLNTRPEPVRLQPENTGAKLHEIVSAPSHGRTSVRHPGSQLRPLPDIAGPHRQ